LTNKNSSENASVEAERVMNRVPSNSSYLNKISHSGNNVKQALASQKEAAKQTSNLLKRAGEVEPSVNIY